MAAPGGEGGGGAAVVSTGRLANLGLALVVVGGALSAAALLDDGARARFAHAYLWGFAFLWTLVLGGLFFVGLQHLTHATWSVVLRRVAEMVAAPQGMVALLFLPVLGFMWIGGPFRLYPWVDAPVPHGGDFKAIYLEPGFFAARAAVFFMLWIGFARFFVGTSLRQDRGEGGPEATARMRRVAAPFTLVFAGTASFAAIDWLMSLAPAWFSTIFGVYVFAGMVLSALAAITIAAVALRRVGALGAGMVTDDHLYNLGALLFAFVCFWAYIAFSQYMLIWYANMPEEAFYLVDRLKGGWLGVSLALGLVRFVVPFLALLSQRAKMEPRILVGVSVLVLLGQFLDLHWLIMPEQGTGGPRLGWPEVGPPLLMVGLLLLHCARFLRLHAPVALGDPLLDVSRGFRL